MILETGRLAFREMTPDDLDFVATMLGHPEVMRYYPKCLDRDESAAWIERQRDRYIEHGYGLWLVLDRATGEPVGQVGPVPREIDGVFHVEIGYLIHRPQWRRGLATEAAGAIRDYVFETIDRPKVICLIRPENLPSQGVALKVGLTRESGRTLELLGFTHWVYSASVKRPSS